MIKVHIKTEDMKIKKISQSKYKKYGAYYCGPVCIEMVLSNFNIKIKAPKVYNLINKDWVKHKEDGFKKIGWTDIDDHKRIFRKFKLKVKNIKRNQLKPRYIKRLTERNTPIIVNIESFRPSNPHGHFVVVTGYKNGKIHFNDPESISREPSKFSIFMGHVKKGLTYCAISISR